MALKNFWIVAIGVSLVVIIPFVMWGMPQYNIYSKRLKGEASLQQAQYDRQIAVAEAHAKMESAKLLAQAEVERAKGVAQANKIIGDSLQGNEIYLKYLWVNNLENSKNQVIYIPTEANLPLLEAGKRK
jgi:regulator of protease activity HflC (stomatin/prohibitin superfamily)